MLECAPVRPFSIIVLLAVAVPCVGDVTIHLKNGRTIVADSVAEKNGRVQYNIGEDEYAIPKSAVERIENAPSQPLSGERVRPGRDSGALVHSPAALPTTAFRGLPAADRLMSRVVRDGKVDDEALAVLERGDNAEVTAAGFFAAGRFHFERGNRDRARFYFERAMGFAPQNDTILSHFAATLIQLGRAGEAVPFAERAARLAPNLVVAFFVLGFV